MIIYLKNKKKSRSDYTPRNKKIMKKIGWTGKSKERENRNTFSFPSLTVPPFRSHLPFHSSAAAQPTINFPGKIIHHFFLSFSRQPKKTPRIKKWRNFQSLDVYVALPRCCLFLYSVPLNYSFLSLSRPTNTLKISRKSKDSKTFSS